MDSLLARMIETLCDVVVAVRLAYVSRGTKNLRTACQVMFCALTARPPPPPSWSSPFKGDNGPRHALA